MDLCNLGLREDVGLEGRARAGGNSDCEQPLHLLEIVRCRLRLEVEFCNLGLKLRGRKGARVLAGVTGGLKAARLTAIMGPSGAGKSDLNTFIHAHSAEVTGGGP